MIATRFVVPVMLALATQHAWAVDSDDITPYRPSVSNPARLPTPGQLELEFGGLRGKDSEVRNASLPYLLKLAFSKEWGVLLGGDAYTWSRDEQGNRVHSVGDTTLTLKRAFNLTDATAFGLELDAKIPTAKSTIGSGKPEYTLNGIYSQDLGRVHMDVNLNTTRVGMPEPGTGRMQNGLSAAFSMPIVARWSGTVEFAGEQRKGTPTNAQLLTAIVYRPTKRLAIDVGVTKGLNKASQDWSVYSGFVIPIARLW